MNDGIDCNMGENFDVGLLGEEIVQPTPSFNPDSLRTSSALMNCWPSSSSSGRRLPTPPTHSQRVIWTPVRYDDSWTQQASAIEGD
jgi:hypothetical protein